MFKKYEDLLKKSGFILNTTKTITDFTPVSGQKDLYTMNNTTNPGKKYYIKQKKFNDILNVPDINYAYGEIGFVSLLDPRILHFTEAFWNSDRKAHLYVAFCYPEIDYSLKEYIENFHSDPLHLIYIEQILYELFDIFQGLNEKKLYFNVTNDSEILIKDNKVFVPDLELFQTHSQLIDTAGNNAIDSTHYNSKFFFVNTPSLKTNLVFLGVLIFQILCGNDVALYDRRNMWEWEQKTKDRYNCLLPSFQNMLTCAFYLTDKETNEQYYNLIKDHFKLAKNGINKPLFK